VELPDGRVGSFLIALAAQVADDGLEHRLGHQVPAKRPLNPDRSWLRTGQPRRTEQRPEPIAPGNRANDAFDTGHQTQALAIQAKRVRHGGGPRDRPAA